MTQRQQQILAEIDDLLPELDRAKSASPYNDLSGGIGDGELRGISTRFLAAIERYSPPGSPYRREAAATGGGEGHRLLQLAGILGALRTDIASGYLATVEQLVHAEVFADFLEMSSELVAKGYKDPAAVVAGSVLEEHLRKLAVASGVPWESPDGKPLRADRVNGDLAKAGVYNRLEQKSVTAWLDLRNKAAHGEYEDYDHRQVAQLIDSVRDFLLRHPA